MMFAQIIQRKRRAEGRLTGHRQKGSRTNDMEDYFKKLRGQERDRTRIVERVKGLPGLKQESH